MNLGQNSYNVVKHNLSEFTPTKHHFNVCENDSFTVASRFKRYIKEKITHSRLSSRHLPQETRVGLIKEPESFVAT